MKVSTRGRYGVNAAVELAVHYGQGPLSIKQISQAQQIPQPYLEQLLAQLRREGLVTSSRGAQGGYMLAQPPEAITVGRVLYAVEGPMAPAACLVEGSESCSREKCCAGRKLWDKIYDSIRQVIDHMTLADLLEDQCIQEGLKQQDEQ